MPYNTRRKSLSLSSLGIHLPNNSRSRRSPSIHKTSPTEETRPPPSKRAKRIHDSSSESVGLSAQTPPYTTDTDAGVSKDVSNSSGYEHTPPPSPTYSGIDVKIDTEGINDDIVVAVIEQLERTGNRPHIIKELAAALCTTNASVAGSANAAALISSRINIYLKRQWTALSPCPLIKETIPVHPRKVFFYLKNSPHQPIPDNSDGVVSPTTEAQQITPTPSNLSIDQDDFDDSIARERARLSPSPEVDLSMTQFDDTAGDDLAEREPSVASLGGGSRFSAESTLARGRRLSHNHRAVSPPLEGDEKEFTQTATSVRERTSSSEDISSKQRRAGEGGTENAPADISEIESGVDGAVRDTDTEGQISPSDHGDSANDEYDDYFSSHILQQHNEPQELDSAVADTMFGASPSPSTSSELTALSSTTTATSIADEGVEPSKRSTDDVTDMNLDTENKEEDTSLLSSVASVEVQRDNDVSASKTAVTDLKTPTLQNDVGSAKRTAHRLSIKAAACSADLELSAASGITPLMDIGMLGQDSWIDLRSPETVEVEELDEIFADL